MAAVCAGARCGLVLMHMKGTPRTMQDDPTYEDVVAEVREFLAARLEVAAAAGVDPERVWVDPGIGFGKTVAHNLELIARIDRIADLGRPVVLGASRKNFLGAITGREVGERLGGSIAAALAALAGGASVLRVHAVAATVAAIRVADAIAGRRAALVGADR
jgi:dihydropteroate synthase